MFADVEKNAQRQQDLFGPKHSLRIEDYYPELHDAQSGPFACTICSHLIPDLLTHRRILIDLDDLRTEDDLIQRFGVDKKFLLEAQRRELVIAATNLDPERHKNNTWMHDILANENTIFKSTRTPHFFRARYPAIVDIQRDLQKLIAARLEAISCQDYATFISHMDVVPHNAPRAGAANKLAWDIVRIDAIHRGGTILYPSPSDRTEDSYTFDDIFERPEETLNLLYRDKLIAVSPHSGALGGTMLVPYEQVKRLFPKVPSKTILSEGLPSHREILPSHREIMNYLAMVRLKLSPVDLTSADYWRHVRHLEWRELLDDLQNDEERDRTAKTEHNLRLRIAKSDPSVNVDEIKELVESDIAWVKKHEKFGSIGYNFTNSIFAIFIAQLSGWYWLGASSWFGGHLMKANSVKIVEYAAPRIQVANFVRSHTRS